MWHEVSKCDKLALEIAKPHYSRAKPDSNELGPPGQKIVFVSDDWKALWGSHRPAPWAGVKRMDGFEGHSCFIFRNAGSQYLSSGMIREAVALTARRWGIAPFITYVATDKVRSNNPGFCFLKAGFRRVGYKDKTKHGRMARLEMDAMEVKCCLLEKQILEERVA